MSAIKIPRRGVGRQSDKNAARYDEEVKEFCFRLNEIAKSIPIEVSSRGWCYLLEEHGLSKGDFDKAQDLINTCRENGLLPLDICAEDVAREANLRVDHKDWHDLGEFAEETFAEVILEYRNAEETAKDSIREATYAPHGFWDFQSTYVEVLVEKIDLRSLFADECRRYYVPIQNAKGWNDLHSRGAILARMQAHQEAGRKCVLLYCGDHDPAGLNISASLRNNFAQLNGCHYRDGRRINLDLEQIEFRRFGLNYDFIKANGLTWIDNLFTGTGQDLTNKDHRHHNHEYVQRYLKQYGARKCEANALVTRFKSSQELIRAALREFITVDGITKWSKANENATAEVREALKAMARAEMGWEL